MRKGETLYITDRIEQTNWNVPASWKFIQHFQKKFIAGAVVVCGLGVIALSQKFILKEFQENWRENTRIYKIIMLADWRLHASKTKMKMIKFYLHSFIN